MIVKNLIDLVRGFTGEIISKKYPNAVMVHLYNQAISKISSELYLNLETNTLSTVSGQQSYDLPSNLIKIVSVTIDDTARTDIKVVGNKLYFDDDITADGTDNLVVKFYSSMTANQLPLTVDYDSIANTVIDLPDMYIDLVVKFMLYQIFLYENDQRAGIQLSLFQQGLKEARVLEDRKTIKDTRFTLE